MVKKVILGSLLVMLLSMVVVLMLGTAAFAATPPASCAAHCAILSGLPGGSGQGVSALAKLGWMGGPNGIAQMMVPCPGGPPNDDCCTAWADKFDK